MARSLGLLLAFVVVLYGATTLPGGRPEAIFYPWLDGLLRTFGQVLAAGIVTHVALRRRNPLWTLLAVSLWLRLLGTLILTATIDPANPVPGVATEVLWFASTCTILVALLMRVVARVRALSVLPVMDVLAGAAAVTSASLTVLYVPLSDIAAATGALITVLYVVHAAADTLILVCVLALLASTGFRATLSRGLLAAGLMVISVADLALRYRVGSGEYPVGSWILGLSLAGMAVVAAAAAAPDDPGPPMTQPPGVWLPVVYVLVATCVMVAAAYSDVSVVALALAVAALLIEVVRGMRTVALETQRADRRVSAAEIESWRFQRLAESSSDVVAMVSARGEVSYLNPVGRRIAGVEPDEVADLVITDLLTESSRRDWDAMQDVLAAQGWVESELELRGQHGPVPVVVSTFTIHAEGGDDRFALGVTMHDITLRRRAQEEAARLSAERRELLRRLTLAQEDERLRVAADIHDDSVQVLASLHLRLTMLQDKLATRDPALHDDVTQVVTTLESAMRRLRHLMFDLDSPARRGGLDDALEQAAAHALGREVRWTLDYQVPQPLSEEVRVTAYRIAVEALTNVRRHAEASRVEMVARVEDDSLVLLVTDDGRGAGDDDLLPRPGHLGLAAMQDRARASGGTVDLERLAPPGGTRLRVVLPLEGSVAVSGAAAVQSTS